MMSIFVEICDPRADRQNIPYFSVELSNTGNCRIIKVELSNTGNCRIIKNVEFKKRDLLSNVEYWKINFRQKKDPFLGSSFYYLFL